MDQKFIYGRNIYENIAFAQRVTETPGRIIKKKVPAALSLVGLAQKYKAFPKEKESCLLKNYITFNKKVQKAYILSKDEKNAKNAELLYRVIGTGEKYSFLEIQLFLLCKNNHSNLKGIFSYVKYLR